MIKTVLNLKKKLAVFMLAGLLVGQGSGYLAQKLMVENNILRLVDNSTVSEELAENLNIEISLSLTDGNLETINNLLLTVEAVNDTPIFNSQNYYNQVCDYNVLKKMNCYFNTYLF